MILKITVVAYFKKRRNNRLTVRECIKQINEQHGIRGFYKGITASYYGMAETVIHFVIYEAIKARLQERYSGDSTNWTDFLRCMVAGATSKTIATCVAYPHGKYCRFLIVYAGESNSFVIHF